MPTNCLSVFNHFVGLALKGLNKRKHYSLKILFSLTYFMPLVSFYNPWNNRKTKDTRETLGQVANDSDLSQQVHNISIVHCIKISEASTHWQFIGNKTKGWISERVLQENKKRQIFQKNEHFLRLDTHTQVCVSEGNKCSFFEKFGGLCFLNTHFEIRPFVFIAYEFLAISSYTPSTHIK